MKIMWLRANVPSAMQAVRHLCMAEWIVRSLGGDAVAEASLSSRTGMLDISTRTPYPVAVDLVGDLLPQRSIWAGDPAGHASADGLPQVLRGAVLTVAGLDHQAALLVAGAARDGGLFDSMGTAEAIVRTVAAPVPVDQVEWLTDRDIDVDWSVQPGHLAFVAARLTGLSLERVASMLGATDREARQALGAAALGAVRDASAPRLVDVGNDAFTIAGITDGITPALTWRVAVEDLTALLGVALDQMSTVAGPHTSAVLAGGWTRNPMVAAAKSLQLGPHDVMDIPEPGALGAAYLAGVAAGLLERPGIDGVPRWAAG
jgi:sugar (pentulose or hexulose) kinase